MKKSINNIDNAYAQKVWEVFEIKNLAESIMTCMF